MCITHVLVLNCLNYEISQKRSTIRIIDFYGKVYNDDSHVFSDFYYRTTSISSVSSDGDSGILVSFGCYHYSQSTI